jgi:hypothetical protein
MSYLNIGGGCDSCSTVGMDVPMNQMQGMDQNSNLVANMVNVPSINNSMNSVNGMSNTSMNNIVNTQNMNSGVNNAMVQMNGGVATNNATNNNVAVNGAMNNAVMNNAVMNNSNSRVNNAVVMPQMNSVGNNVVPNNNGQKKRALVSPTNLVMLGLVIFAALASNESAAYHLNQAVKFNEANPMYYVLYAVVAILLCLAAYHYMTSN